MFVDSRLRPRRRPASDLCPFPSNISLSSCVGDLTEVSALLMETPVESLSYFLSSSEWEMTPSAAWS